MAQPSLKKIENDQEIGYVFSAAEAFFKISFTKDDFPALQVEYAQDSNTAVSTKTTFNMLSWDSDNLFQSLSEIFMRLKIDYQNYCATKIQSSAESVMK